MYHTVCCPTGHHHTALGVACVVVSLATPNGQLSTQDTSFCEHGCGTRNHPACGLCLSMHFCKPHQAPPSPTDQLIFDITAFAQLFCGVLTSCGVACETNSSHCILSYRSPTCCLVGWVWLGCSLAVVSCPTGHQHAAWWAGCGGGVRLLPGSTAIASETGQGADGYSSRSGVQRSPASPAPVLAALLPCQEEVTHLPWGAIPVPGYLY